MHAYIKDACLITIRNKTTVWKLTSSSPIESEHPYLRNLKIHYKNQTVEITTNTKHIIQQNNFTNINLNTTGKQLTRINIFRNLYFLLLKLQNLLNKS